MHAVLVCVACHLKPTNAVFGVNSLALMTRPSPRWVETMRVRRRGAQATVEVQAVVQPQVALRTVAAAVAAAATEGATVAAPLRHTAVLVHC